MKKTILKKKRSNQNERDAQKKISSSQKTNFAHVEEKNTTSGPMAGNITNKEKNVFGNYEEFSEIIKRYTHATKNRIEKKIGNLRIKSLLGNANRIHIYDGVTFRKPVIQFIFNVRNCKIYFRINEDKISKYVVCSNNMKNIIDDNINTKRRIENIYELNDMYIDQFHSFPTYNFNDENNNFYPCYCIYKVIFDNLEGLQEKYESSKSKKINKVCKFIYEKTQEISEDMIKRGVKQGDPFQSVLYIQSYQNDMAKFCMIKHVNQI